MLKHPADGVDAYTNAHASLTIALCHLEKSFDNFDRYYDDLALTLSRSKQIFTSNFEESSPFSS